MQNFTGTNGEPLTNSREYVTWRIPWRRESVRERIFKVLAANVKLFPQVREKIFWTRIFFLKAFLEASFGRSLNQDGDGRNPDEAGIGNRRVRRVYADRASAACR